jgi:hypothetical protein
MRKRNDPRVLLTAWYFAEVYELRVGFSSVAGSEVAVLVTFVKPRIVVGREAGRRVTAGLHALLQRQETPEHLSAARYVETLVNCYDLH